MSGVIELDPAAPWEPESPPAPRRPPRWLLPAVVAVVTVVTVTAAVPPVRRDPVLSLREANTTLRFGSDDTVYVMTQRTRSGRLQAYPPGRTRPAWTVNFPGGYPVPVSLDDPDLVLLTVFDADPNVQDDGESVQARDARTGQLRWDRPGMGLLGSGIDVAVVTDRRESGVPVSAPDTPGHTVEALDRRTGRTRWTRTVPPDVLVGWADDTVVHLAPDGLVRLDDAATGTTRREVRIAPTGRPFHAFVDRGLLVVYQDGDRPDTPTSVGYDLDTGEERWRRGTLLGGECGDRWLCSDDPGQLTVTDAGSGAVRYRGPSDNFVIRGDRLIVSSAPAPGGPAVTEIHDLATGRRVHTLPAWTLVGINETDLVIQHLAGSGLLVATVDAATGRLTTLGRATDWSGTATCHHGVRSVGCFGTSGVRVWRVADGKGLAKQ